MCGIIGYLSATTPIDPGLFDAMRDMSTHRGPDGAGSWMSQDRRVALGHRRLAIIDLTEGGFQPMSSPDERYIITYNGEIYNYKELREELRARGHAFKTDSDTEVLLAAYLEWGDAAPTHLQGMFAFAIFDRKTQSLFAARDRAGEKPFFYRQAGRGLIFGSELKMLLRDPEVPREADPVALDHYLAYGHVPRELCLLKGFAKLPAGHSLRYDLNADSLSVTAYWTLPRREADAAEQTFDALVDELEPLLDQAVRRQLVADVPVGVLLSGGLDSSLIAATATRVSSRVQTFTIGFPDHSAYDESPLAKRLASELGTDHVELMVNPNAYDLLPQLAAQFDEPIADSSMIPTFIVSQLVRTRATVALGGDGGDELFGGYHHHAWMQNMAKLRAAGIHRLPLARSLADAALPYRAKARKTVLRLFDKYDPAITVTRLMEPSLRQALIGPRHLVPNQAAEQFRADLIGDWVEPRERAMALDYLTYMCDDILVKVDRSSMLASLEVRAPMLDPAIIEFAFGRLSPERRVSQSGRKLMLRHLAKRRLPAWFDTARKQGFSIPLPAWLRGPWKPLLDDIASSADDSLLDPQAVRRFLAGGLAADRLAHPVFQIAMLELWRRQYNVRMA